MLGQKERHGLELRDDGGPNIGIAITDNQRPQQRRLCGDVAGRKQIIHDLMLIWRIESSAVAVSAVATVAVAIAAVTVPILPIRAMAILWEEIAGLHPDFYDDIFGTASVFAAKQHFVVAAKCDVKARARIVMQRATRDVSTALRPHLLKPAENLIERVGANHAAASSRPFVPMKWSTTIEIAARTEGLIFGMFSSNQTR